MVQVYETDEDVSVADRVAQALAAKREVAVTIYGLIDPHTRALHYIGQTVNPLAERLSDHYAEARDSSSDKTRKDVWLAGLDRGVIAIEMDHASTDLGFALESAYIFYAAHAGCDLYNRTIPTTFKGTIPRDRQRHVLSVMERVLASDLSSFHCHECDALYARQRSAPSVPLGKRLDAALDRIAVLEQAVADLRAQVTQLVACNA